MTRIFGIDLGTTNSLIAVMEGKTPRVIADLAISHARSAAGRNVTLSQGIASLIPEKETASEDLIQRADQALYQAKQQGRNRYVVFGGK